MSESNRCDEPLYFSGLLERISESLTEAQWIVIERRFVYGDTLEAIGGFLGVASVRVRHIQNTALDEIIKLLHEEIECFSIKLEKLLSDAGGALTIKECLEEFPISDKAEFIILFTACQKNRDEIFHRSKEFISIKDS